MLLLMYNSLISRYCLPNPWFRVDEDQLGQDLVYDIPLFTYAYWTCTLTRKIVEEGQYRQAAYKVGKNNISNRRAADTYGINFMTLDRFCKTLTAVQVTGEQNAFLHARANVIFKKILTDGQ